MRFVIEVRADRLLEFIDHVDVGLGGTCQVHGIRSHDEAGICHRGSDRIDGHVQDEAETCLVVAQAHDSALRGAHWTMTPTLPPNLRRTWRA